MRNVANLRCNANSVISRRWCGPLLLGCMGAVVAAHACGGAETDDEFFRQQVAPIFEQHCVACHQGKEPQGGLSLVDAVGLQAGGESGPIVKPGVPGGSLLLEQVSGEKPAMPKNARPLTAEQLDVLRAWVSGGAKWPPALTLVDRRTIDAHWWSLEPLTRPAVPVIELPPTESARVRNPLDAFLLAGLRAAGLTGSPEADRRTLIRRLTYDLHGLPPTPEEIAKFLADPRDDAYEQLVDRLLASPRYGERWGRHWLDVVHYGETHGYDKDKPRLHAWPYRDYVIDALNRDKPYGRFIEEQLAGDVLVSRRAAGHRRDRIRRRPARGTTSGTPNCARGRSTRRSPARTTATTWWPTTASTFLSLTVHCARCHNHKFDPITQSRLLPLAGGVRRRRSGATGRYDPDPQVAHRRSGTYGRRSAAAAPNDEIRTAIAGRQCHPSYNRSERSSLPGSASNGPKRLLRRIGRSGTLGYHSLIMPRADETKWVQVDLGAVAADRRNRPGAGPRGLWRTSWAGLWVSATLSSRDFRYCPTLPPRGRCLRSLPTHTQADFAESRRRAGANPDGGQCGTLCARDCHAAVESYGRLVLCAGANWRCCPIGHRRGRRGGRQRARFDRSGAFLGTGKPGRWLQQPGAVAILVAAAKRTHRGSSWRESDELGCKRNAVT